MNWLRSVLLFSVLLMVFPGGPASAAAPGASAPAGPEETEAQKSLRSYVQLQEMIHDTQLVIERNRTEAEAASARNAFAVAEKLAAIDKNLRTQKVRELDTMQASNEIILIVAASLIAMSLCAVLVMGYLQSRAISRLAEISAELSATPSAAAPDPGVGSGDDRAPGSAEESNLRLLGALEHLERRLDQLETTGAVPAADSRENGNGDGADEPEPVSVAASLLAKGQSLIEAGQAEEALKCFDEAVRLEPGSTEALIKRGSALERLQKLDAAIECYDRAIAANHSLTIAYLYKAGIYNRMERFGEALACYEKALQTQEKKSS